MKHLLFLTSLLLPVTAHAASPTSDVGSAAVDKGKSTVEARAGYTQDDNDTGNDHRLRFRQHFDYGFTDWYAARLTFSQDKRNGNALEHQGISFENRFQLIERREHGWDAGVRLIYTQADGDKTPHEIDALFLATVPFAGTWEWRHNTVVEHDIGPDSTAGLSLELRNQVTHALATNLPVKKLQLGVEMYNDFGRLREVNGYSKQDHQLGPLVKTSFNNGMYLQAGYRAGISTDAPDNLAKLFLGFNF